jgi:HEAT repeats
MSTVTLIRPLGARGVRRRFEEQHTDTAASAPNLRVITAEDSADSRTTDDPVPWDDSDFARAPRSVLRRVLLTVVRDPAQRGPMTRELFPMMLKGTPARTRLVYETLRKFAEPQDVLINSLLLHLRRGDAEPLVIGAGLLEDLGAVSWPVLAAFARTGRPECAYFVATIAGLQNVDVKKRLEVLEILARSEDSELRWRIYEALGDFSLDDAVPALSVLAGADSPDDAARSAATERIQSSVEE